MTTTPAVDWSQAPCAQLPLLEGARIFCGETPGGALQRTSIHPAPDTFTAARRLCPACPLLDACLTAALRDDGVTFRGMSSEERAVFGGVRTKRARQRPLYLTPPQVLARVEASGYDTQLLLRTLAAHEQWLEDHPVDAQQRAPQPGWSRQWRAGEETFQQCWDRVAEVSESVFS